MSEPFDAYHIWLGIPQEEQPPNHYRLLSIRLFESHADVIENAADRLMAHLRTFQTGKHSALSQRLLNEVAQAKLCLLAASRRAEYDARLRATLATLNSDASTSDGDSSRVDAALFQSLVDGSQAPTRAIAHAVSPQKPGKHRRLVIAASIGAAVPLILLIGLMALRSGPKPAAQAPLAQAESVKTAETKPKLSDTTPAHLPVRQDAPAVPAPATSATSAQPTPVLAGNAPGAPTNSSTATPPGAPSTSDSSGMASAGPVGAPSTNPPDGIKGLRPAGPAPIAPVSDPPHVISDGQRQEAERLKMPVELTNSVGMRLVLIPAGEFDMGSSPEEISRVIQAAQQQNNRATESLTASEGPVHRVRISRAFYLGALEVTQGEYQRIMGTNPSSYSANGRNARIVQDQDTSRYPVESVSWEDAQQFCQKLSALPDEQAGQRNYRLPSEAEWEYSCRAGSTTRWSCGDDEAALGGYASYRGNIRGSRYVGQKNPNAWGLFDMHGSVGEWCQDCYASEFYARSPAADPVFPQGNAMRVVRGGNWMRDALSCRSASRTSYPTIAHVSTVGLRVVCQIGAPAVPESPEKPVAPAGPDVAAGKDAPAAVLLHTLKPYSDTVEHLAFNSAGGILATVDRNRTLVSWDMANSNAPVGTLRLNNHCYSLQFHPRKDLLAIGHSQSVIFINSVGRTVGEFNRNSNAQGGFFQGCAFSADGAWLAINTSDDKIGIVSANNLLPVRALDSPFRNLSSPVFSLDGKTLAAGSGGARTVFWTVATGNQAGTLEMEGTFLGFLSDGKQIMLANSREFAAQLADRVSGQSVRSYTFGELPRSNVGYTSGVGALSADGALVAVARGNVAVLWDVASGRRLTVLEGHVESIRRMVFTPNARLLATAGEDKSVRVWDLKAFVGEKPIGGKGRPKKPAAAPRGK